MLEIHANTMLIASRLRLCGQARPAGDCEGRRHPADRTGAEKVRFHVPQDQGRGT